MIVSGFQHLFAAGCHMRCHLHLRFVCGSDGKTYANECVMRRASCMKGEAIVAVHKGKCLSECLLCERGQSKQPFSRAGKINPFFVQFIVINFKTKYSLSPLHLKNVLFFCLDVYTGWATKKQATLKRCHS